MKLYRYVLFAVFFLVVLPKVAAEQPTAGSRKADHEALRALKTKVVAAINAQDLDALASCFTHTFAFTGADQTLVTTPSELKAYYQRIFTQTDSPVTAIQTEAEAGALTCFIDANAGYCYGTSTDTYTLRGGRKVCMENRWTATVVKSDGGWKVATAHVGVNFLDNPVLDARTMPLWRKVGVLMGLTKAPGEK